MNKIESFKVNHNVLKPGIYISRVDGDVITYDIRMKTPNGGDYLATTAMHTIEHIFATYARNSEYADNVIYFGPMGCRTGFYLLLRDSVSHRQTLELIRAAFAFIAEFNGEIPGSSPIECGNYAEHDLVLAKAESKAMSDIIRDWCEEDMIYAS